MVYLVRFFKVYRSAALFKLSARTFFLTCRLCSLYPALLPYVLSFPWPLLHPLLQTSAEIMVPGVAAQAWWLVALLQPTLLPLHAPHDRRQHPRSVLPAASRCRFPKCFLINTCKPSVKASSPA